jgi:hypothetical protein
MTDAVGSVLLAWFGRHTPGRGGVDCATCGGVPAD